MNAVILDEPADLLLRTSSTLQDYNLCKELSTDALMKYPAVPDWDKLQLLQNKHEYQKKNQLNIFLWYNVYAVGFPRINTSLITQVLLFSAQDSVHVQVSYFRLWNHVISAKTVSSILSNSQQVLHILESLMTYHVFVSYLRGYSSFSPSKLLYKILCSRVHDIIQSRLYAFTLFGKITA